MKYVLDEKLHKVFLLVSLIFGIAYLIATPPLRNFDEAFHSIKVFALSNGDTSQTQLPDDFRAFLVNHFPGHVLKKGGKYDWEKVMATMATSGDFSKTSTVEANPADPYFFTSYWPAILTTSLLKAVYPSSGMIFFAARLSLLLTATIILAYTIKHAAIDRRILFFISLMPMALFIRSGINADGLTFAYCMAYINVIFLALRNPQSRYFMWLLGLGILVALSKNIHFLLVLLVLILPVFKLEKPKSYYLQIGLLLFIPLLCAIIWNSFVLHYTTPPNVASTWLWDYLGSTNRVDGRIHAGKQLAHILQHLALFAQNIYQSIIWWMQNSAPSIMGIINVNTRMSFNPNHLLLFTGLISLFFVGAPNPLLRQKRWLFGLVFALATLAIFTALYLYFTPVGIQKIRGVQGRYFLPFLILLPLIASAPYWQKHRNSIFAYTGLLWLWLNLEALYNILQTSY